LEQSKHLTEERGKPRQPVSREPATEHSVSIMNSRQQSCKRNKGMPVCFLMWVLLL